MEGAADGAVVVCTGAYELGLSGLPSFTLSLSFSRSATLALTSPAAFSDTAPHPWGLMRAGLINRRNSSALHEVR